MILRHQTKISPRTTFLDFKNYSVNTVTLTLNDVTVLLSLTKGTDKYKNRKLSNFPSVLITLIKLYL